MLFFCTHHFFDKDQSVTIQGNMPCHAMPCHDDQGKTHVQSPFNLFSGLLPE